MNFQTNTFTILIVDDTPSNLSVVVDLLEESGYNVAIAQDGEEGLQRAQLLQPDLILLDVMLPGADGFEICRRLKAAEETRDIPVIFMTALVATERKVNGFDVGGVDYITKPLQIDEIIARVGTHLKLRAAQKRLEEQNAQLQNCREQLERRVAACTAELKASNQQLRMEISEHKRTGQQLLMMDFALNRMREAAYLIDRQLQFIYVNDEACRALGYSREELLKMTMYDIDPDATHEEMTATRDQDGLVVIERRHKTKEGAVFSVEIHITSFEYEGVALTLSLARDISERKRMQS
ncbi:MAG: response regulator [Methylobacter sp.]|nr:MAG: response regulator [Methylobacter sp.]